ncbi:TPA: elongation factor EF-2, partial [Candidatus Micrarchaeota archaeon]|nr:elongation factor EF-2 [Candidatus Micrarchaeota archaeon]
EPVVTIAIEPKHSRDLPKLIEALRKLTIEDPNLHVKINQETGEYLLSGMGTLHLEIAIHMLEDQGLEVTASLPIVVYRETVKGRSSDFPGKSPNKHNKFLLRVEPLEPEIVDMITSGELTDDMDRKRLSKILFEMGWPTEEARNVWCVDERGNMLINVTKGVQYLDEAKSMIISAFKSACEEGVLAREPVRGMRVLLLDAQLHEDPALRTFAQIFPAIRRAIYGAFLEAKPTLLEPQMLLSVQVPPDYVGTVTSVISSKRGVVLGMEHREYFVVIDGEVPVSETFDLAQVLRGATAGRAFWQMTFRRWGEVPQSLLPRVLAEVRRRKGLPEKLPSPEDFRPT